MASTFELQTDAVRDYLQQTVARVPQCELRETLTYDLNFIQFEITGTPGTANFVIVVNQSTEHFEFSVGAHIRYEGDWDAFPRTLDYFYDLVDAVINGDVYETHYYLISPRISCLAKVEGRILLARYEAFEFTQLFSLLSLLARRKILHRYLPY